MDAFERAERNLKQSMVRITPQSTAVNQGETQVRELPPARQVPPSARPAIQIGPDGARIGGDPFDQAEARLRTRQGIQSGENLVPHLRRQARMGVGHGQPDTFDREAAHRQQAAAMMPGQRPAAAVGGLLGDGAETQHLDYQTWSELRRRWQIQYPHEPLPPELQVFGFVGHQTEDGEPISMTDLQPFAFGNRDRELLHDEQMIQEARERWAGPMLEILHGTQDQRMQTAAAAHLQGLRAKYPAAAEFSDEQLLEFDAEQLERQAREFVLGTVRSVLGDAPASDDELMQLLERAPEAFAEAMVEAQLPAAIENAMQRQTQRELVGMLEDDTPDSIRAERELLAYAQAREAGQRMSAITIIPHVMSLGDLATWVDAANLGLPGLMARAWGQGDAYRGAMDGYAELHPWSALIYGLAGYMTPGSPAFFAGRGLSKLFGQPVRAAVAHSAGQRTLREAGRAAMQPPPADAYARVGMAGKAAADTTATATTMPAFLGATAAARGDWQGMARAFDLGDEETRTAVAAGGALGAVVSAAPRMIVPALRRVSAEVEFAFKHRGRFNDLDIAFSGRGKEALQRLRRFQDNLDGGDEFWTAAQKANVSSSDIQFMRSLSQAVRRAKGALDREAREAARPAGAQPGLPQARVVAREAPGAPPATETARPSTAGREMLPPKLARWMRDKHLLAEMRAGRIERPELPQIIRDLQAEQAENIGRLERLKREATGARAQEIEQRIKQLEGAYERELAEIEARKGEFPAQGPEGRELPKAPKDLGDLRWIPKLSSLAAAKARARAKGIASEGVTFSRTQQVYIGHVLDAPAAEPSAIAAAKRKLKWGDDSQADAVPPLVVRRLANGGYQLLDGAEQYHAAKELRFQQVPVIVAEGAAAPTVQKPQTPKQVTGTPPRSIPQDTAARKARLAESVKPGEVIHGTDARNLEWIVRQGLQPSGLSGDVDAEVVPAGGFGPDVPSTAITYAAGRAKELPVVLVLKPATNRGPRDRSLVRGVAATSEGKSYVLPGDIEAVIFPDGMRLPLDEAVRYWQRIRTTLTRQMPREGEGATLPPTQKGGTHGVQHEEGQPGQEVAGGEVVTGQVREGIRQADGGQVQEGHDQGQGQDVGSKAGPGAVEGDTGAGLTTHITVDGLRIRVEGLTTGRLAIHQVDYSQPFPYSATGFHSLAGRASSEAELRELLPQKAAEVAKEMRKLPPWLRKHGDLGNALRAASRLRAAVDLRVRDQIIKLLNKHIAEHHAAMAAGKYPRYEPADKQWRAVEAVVRAVEAGRWDVFADLDSMGLERFTWDKEGTDIDAFLAKWAKPAEPAKPADMETEIERLFDEYGVSVRSIKREGDTVIVRRQLPTKEREQTQRLTNELRRRGFEVTHDGARGIHIRRPQPAKVPEHDAPTSAMWAQAEQFKQQYGGYIVAFKHAGAVFFLGGDALVAQRAAVGQRQRGEHGLYVRLPESELESALKKLIQAGHKAAVAEAGERDPKRMITPGSGPAVPEQVRRNLGLAIQRLQTIAYEIEENARVKGPGTADIVRRQRQDQIDGAMRTVDAFRRLAKEKGIDPEPVIEELGGVPSTVATLPASYTAKAGDQIEFADLPEDQQVLLGDLVEDAARGGLERGRFTIREIPIERFPTLKPEEIDTAGRPVSDFHDLAKSGQYPPVIIAGGTWYDGVHRVEALRAIGAKTVRTIDLADAGVTPSKDSSTIGQLQPAKPAEPRKDIPAAPGRTTRIETTGETVPAHYALVEADSLIPSHNFTTFKPHPDYPPNVQERDYQHDKGEQLKVANQVRDFNPAFVLTDNPDPVNGPPMILSSGLVMGGNSRAMTIQDVYHTLTPSDRERYGKLADTFRNLTIEAAVRQGVDKAAAEAMKKPVLVRILDEQTEDPARMRELVRILQRGRTQELSGAMDAASRARILMDHPDSLQRLEHILGDEDSIREVMSKPSKVADLRTWLVQSQVMSRAEYARYTHPETGMLSEDGKRLVERILQAVVVPDVALFDNLPHNTTNKITGNLYALVYPKTKGEGWDIAPQLTEALKAFYRWRQSGLELAEFLSGSGQQLIVPDPITAPENKRANWLLKRLVGDNTVGWRERAKAYLAHTRKFTPGEQTFAFAADTQADPERAFRDSFEADVPKDMSGREISLGKTEKRGGLFGSGGPEKYVHTLDELRELLSWPEQMTPQLRRALRLPRRIREGGMLMMSSAGAKPIDPAELLGDPATAERISRIATFHLEQHAEAGDHLLTRWATGVREDLGSILRDLGYAVDDGGFDGLLARVWQELAADPDVQDVLGELPTFDKEKASAGRSRTVGARRGGPGSSGDRPGVGGRPGEPGTDLEGDSGLPGDGPGTDPGVVGAGARGDVSSDRHPSGEVPEWVPREQWDDYLAALRSERVSPYAPILDPRSGHHHPRVLVESKGLSGIQPGALDGYEPDARAIGDLSDAQRDQVALVGYRIHQHDAGALIADDVGVGKSRVIGGIIADQLWRRIEGLSGKGRVLVLTKNRQNIADLQATLSEEMKQTFEPLKEQWQLDIRSALDQPAESIQQPMHPTVLLLDSYNLVRYADAVDRFKPELILVDEAHLLSNLTGDTQRANTLRDLHEKLLPKGAHFAYFTATPASDLAALEFMYGLGLWYPPEMVKKDKTGEKLSFNSWLSQSAGLSKAGSWRESVATPVIEQLMRELKMDGAYASLDFWRGGFEFEMTEAKVTDQQLDQYDDVANLLRDAIEAYILYRPKVNHGQWPVKGEMKAPPRPDGQAIFAMKRILVEFRMAKAIEIAQEALKKGEQPVFKILGVSDTHLSEGGNMGAVIDAIPTQRAVKNARGEIVQWQVIPEAHQAVHRLRKRAGKIAEGGRIISPLQQLLDAFGEKNVAAIVGATPPDARVQQMGEFQAGKRKVAIISSAGTTGINAQDLGTGRRRMIVLDLDWDAKEFKQSLGRVDRANQVTSPAAVTIYTPMVGERKIQSTIAVRMKQLGAISKGQEDFGAEADALADFDLESGTWNQAINELLRGGIKGGGIEPIRIGKEITQQEKNLFLRWGKTESDSYTWRDFQNDLMLMPHAVANQFFEAAYNRWRQLEDLEAEKTGGKVARRNRGMIRASVELDEEVPLAIHTVEAITGETYGILSGKLLTRERTHVPLRLIGDAIYGKGGSQALRNHYVTIQQGERVVSGLYVPRGKIETIKALFGRASQKAMFDPPEGGGQPADLPDAIVDQLPRRLQLHATRPNVPEDVQQKKHRPQPSISRQDITDAVIQRLGVAVAVGKQARLRIHALGYYWNKIIRQKWANEIAVLAHEVGHAIDDMLTGLNPPPAFDHELLPLGRHTSRPSYTKHQVRKEGVAEWWRINFFDPDTAAEQAPGFAGWVTEQLGMHPELERAVRDIQGMYAQYLAQDQVQKLEAHIDFDNRRDPTHRSPRQESTIGRLWRAIHDGTIDRFAVLARMRKELEGGGELPERFTSDPWVQANLIAGNRVMIGAWVSRGVHDRDDNKLSDGLEQVFQKHGINTAARAKQFKAYLIAKRADSLYQQQKDGVRTLKETHDALGGPLGVTWDQAKATIARYESESFQAAARGVWDWNKAVLRMLMEYGMFSAQQISDIMAMNPMYVPFHRLRDEAMGRPRGTGGGMADQPRAFHRILGSGRMIKDPITQLIENAAWLVDLATRNQVAIDTMQMIQRKRDYTWADKVARPIRPTSAQLKEIKKALVAAGVDPRDFEEGVDGSPPKIDLETWFTVFRPMRHNPTDGEIALWVKGKPNIWQVHDPALYEALTSDYHVPTNNLLIRLLMVGRRVFGKGVTLPLSFVLGSNPQRETLVAELQSRYGFKNIRLDPTEKRLLQSDTLRGLYHWLRGTPEFYRFMRSRGAFSGRTSMWLDPLQRQERDVHKSPMRRYTERVVLPWRWLEFLESMLMLTENMTRLGENLLALEKEGVGREGMMRAGLASRQVNVDYAQGGHIQRWLGQYRAFVSANWQGKRLMLRNLRHRPHRILWRIVKIIAGLTLLERALAWGDDEWTERRNERRGYWLFKIGEGQYLRWRKPHEWGAIGTAISDAIDTAIEEDPSIMADWKPSLWDVSRTILSFTPDFFRPGMEAAFNHDTWRDRPIVPYWDQELEPHLQFNRYTSETAKVIGKGLNLSPAKIDHLIRGHFGTLGQEAVGLVDDAATRPLLGLADAPPAPARGWTDQVPGVSAWFTRPLSPGGAESLARFYQRRDQLRTVQRSLPRYEGAEYDAYELRHRSLLAQAGQISAADRQLGLLRDRMHHVFEDPEMTPERKQQELRILTIQMINVARDVLDRDPMPEPRTRDPVPKWRPNPE